MESVLKILLVTCVAASFAACQKSGVANNTSKEPLTVSKSTVRLGEPLYVTGGASGNTITKWSVTPSGSSYISTGATTSSSVIVFTRPGTYTVSACYYADSLAQPYDSTSAIINVNDSVYNDSAVAHCNVVVNAPFDSSDEIIITPISYSDTGLVLLANTLSLYNNSPRLNYLLPPVAAGRYEFMFSSVIEFPCTASGYGAAPATAVLGMGALTPGTYPVTFQFLGVDYTGSVEVSGTQCSFTWPYTSGVVISPLQISK